VSASLPLFVFGTLRSGQCNHDLLRGRYDKRLQARLFGYERVGPLMIARRESGFVLGELFFLPSDLSEEIIADCDELEMLPPGETRGEWYERIVVTVSTPEGEFEAWAYARPE
jgi:gamma-glutamylcyclotransferase (GGCT)/AIG2-like uncharacterized protein YtfP